MVPSNARALGDGALLDPPASECSINEQGARRPSEAGSGRLEVRRVDGASAVVSCAARSPLHLFTPRARGRLAHVIATTYGGGLVAGDFIDLELELGHGTATLLTTQAQTKVYRSAGRWAGQRLRARVGEGSALAVLPEPASVFASGRYRQEASFELAGGASLLVVDSLASGRSARGERWAFDAYGSRNTVSVDGRVVMSEAVRLVAGEGPPLLRRMAEAELLGTVIAVGPAFSSLAASLLEELSSRPAEALGGVLAAASAIPGGLFLRLASTSLTAGLEFLRSRVALPAAALAGQRPHVG